MGILWLKRTIWTAALCCAMGLATGSAAAPGAVLVAHTNDLSAPQAAHAPLAPVIKRTVVYVPAAAYSAPTEAPASPGGCGLAFIKNAESHGNYQATNGQYTGAYQQSTHSWQTYGDGSAPTAGQASPASQDAAAARQYAAEGSRPWSTCR